MILPASMTFRVVRISSLDGVTSPDGWLCSKRKEPVYRRPSFYAMRNFYSVFDDDVSVRGFEKRRAGGRELSVARFSRLGRPFAAVWFSGERPGDSLSYEPVDLSFLAADAPSLWIDLMTGRAYALDGLSAAPVWDSPVVLAGDGAIPLDR